MATTEDSRDDRTWLCSVLFSDIVNYSSQPVNRQMEWKRFFNGVLEDALKGIPVDDRIVLDTGDGAAVCFLGDPETALLSGLAVQREFVAAAEEANPKVRLGINLGPVKLVRDVNSNRNALGDGINIAQRIMSFAEPNQILVSRSFYDVISPLSEDYCRMFRYDGVRQDKHVREHTVYELKHDGYDRTPSPAIESVKSGTTAPAPATVPEKKSSAGLWIGLAAVAVAVGLGAFVLFRPKAEPPAAPVEQAKSEPVAAPALAPVSTAPEVPAAKAVAPPIATPAKVAPAPPAAPVASVAGGIAGKWQYDIKYSWGVEVTETMDLKVDGDEVYGTASYLRTPRSIQDGKIDGNKVTFTTHSQTVLGDQTYNEKHVYRGRLTGNGIDFQLDTESGYDTRAPEMFTAKRVP